jgi:hypothetical protein
MKKSSLEAKYTAGQLVTAIKNPGQQLMIRRYYHRIYYCKTIEGEEKEFAFFEAEISPVH